MLDSDCSKTMEEACAANQDIDVQIVAPKNHCVNATKKFIATLKERSIALLSILDNNYPLQNSGDFLGKVQDQDNDFQLSSSPARRRKWPGVGVIEKMAQCQSDGENGPVLD